MCKLPIALLLVSLCTAGVVTQQKLKPWIEWSEKEAEKMLNDSPWGQTQTETNTSEMTYSPTSGSGGSGSATPGAASGIRGEQSSVSKNRATEGAYNKAVTINYRIRFLSARPVREAISALIVQRAAKSDTEKLIAQMQSFVERDYGDFVVVTVTYDAEDQRLSAKAYQEFANALAATLKNNSYLEREDGKRVFLVDYRTPIGDGLGAKFVFPRTVDGKAFLSDKNSELRFYSEVGPNVKLNRRFKVSDMVHQGKLEY